MPVGGNLNIPGHCGFRHDALRRSGIMTNGGTQQPAAHSVDLRGHLKGVAEEVTKAFPEELVLRTWNGPEHDFLRILRNPLVGKFAGATE